MTVVKIDGVRSWAYVAINVDPKLILEVAVFGRRGIDSAAAFLHRLSEKHDCSDTVFLVDSYMDLPSITRFWMSGQLDCIEQNLIGKWFHTL